MAAIDLEEIERERARIAETYLTKADEASSARGIHHAALL